jgi:molybdate/tungstate transport system substrate-binding protein
LIRRDWLFAAAIGAFAASQISRARAQSLTTLDVAYAGSMGSMMEGPIKSQAASALGIDMHGRAAAADALAKLIVDGSIKADVFVSVTAGPMLTVIEAGKTQTATPIARTEMVIAYSPKSRFASQLADAAVNKPGAPPWYEILMQPGLRFGRTDPATDPQGRNIIFTLQLAERFYKRPGLARKILGDAINSTQIFSEPTVEARLQSGELDAASAYKTQPGPFNLPYLSLPDAINLGNESMREHYRRVSLTLRDKTYRPQALVYYAAAITGSAHADKSIAFVKWLSDAASQQIFRKYAYDAPLGAVALHS